MKVTLTSACLLALILTGCSSEKASVPVVKARTGDFERTLVVKGTLAAASTLAIQAESSGKISFMADEGAVVKAGDALFGLETTDQEERLKSAELDLAVARANLGKSVEERRSDLITSELELKEKTAALDFARIKAEQAREDLVKARRQVENQILPKAELARVELSVQQAELSVSNAEIEMEKLREEKTSRKETLSLDMASSQAQLEKVESQVAESREYLEKAIAKAPRDGIVILTVGWRGQPWKVGDEVWPGTSIMELPDLSLMEVAIPLNEVDISGIVSGTPARVRVEAFPDLSLTGHVGEVGGLAKDIRDRDGKSTGLRAFDVTIKLAKQDARLRPGLSATVEILLEQAKDVVLVPAGAVRRDAEGTHVLDATGRRRAVTIASSNSEVSVVTEGLSAGDEILLAPQTEEERKSAVPFPPSEATGPADAGRGRGPSEGGPRRQRGGGSPDGARSGAMPGASMKPPPQQGSALLPSAAAPTAAASVPAGPPP